VKVSYSPTDPADSVLEPGIHPSSWFLPILGGVFVVVPALMLAAGFLYNVYGKKTRRIVDTNPFLT
jgi:hypothetical protein